VIKFPKNRATGRSRSTRTRGAATTRKSKPAAKRKAKVGAAPAPRTPATSEQSAREEEAAFMETLIASGEAARLDEQGRLPVGATHKIVEDEAGNVKVVRRRFSMT
jgi:hypothetical protein